jgi:hypothetical protein
MDPAGGLYGKLEERVLAREQIGASAVFYDLVRAGRPRAEIVRETVRIHAPYASSPALRCSTSIRRCWWVF